jgi:hypothetical protein
MIKLESIHIEEVRGIRKLDLDFRKEKFAICGPNGSGKSGIIDAIEFGLTGQMGRLMGRGTKGLSVGLHGPHVDKVKFPDAAFVSLKVFLTDLKKSVTITRMLSSPKKVSIDPDEPAPCIYERQTPTSLPLDFRIRTIQATNCDLFECYQISGSPKLNQYFERVVSPRCSLQRDVRLGLLLAIRKGVANPGMLLRQCKEPPTVVTQPVAVRFQR